jgi:hypothetical protein
VERGQNRALGDGETKCPDKAQSAQANLEISTKKEILIMNATGFSRFAGLLAIAAGVVGFLYSLSFIVIAQNSPELGATLSGLFLLLGGLLSSAALVALYKHLEGTDSGFALWALVLGVGSTLGAAIHGGYDLANAINPPDTSFVNLASYPNQVDPRGLLTFGAAGLSVLVFSWLISRSADFPRTFGTLGYVLGVLLIVVYLARLIILDATSPVIVMPAVLTGFVVSPIWYIWLGLSLRR